MEDNERAKEIMRRLARSYRGIRKVPLDYASPFQLLVATVLSAQCTDAQVNKTTKALFSKYPGVNEFALARPRDISAYIRSTGLYRIKARNIANAARMLHREYSGTVPSSMQDLMRLPGVGRKTASIILYVIFGKNEGIAVDTHVKRLSVRLGLSESASPSAIERDLAKVFERRDWGRLNRLFIEHGRRVCRARNPRCEECLLSSLCRIGKRKTG